MLRLTHAWAGTFLSLLLAVLGLSGALLVFKNDYVRASVPEARHSALTDPASLAAAITKVEQTYDPVTLQYMTFGNDELGVHHLGFKDEASAYLNVQGVAVTTWEKNGRFEDWLFDLHRHLLSGDTGEVIAGIAALLAAFICLTGLVIWWPTRQSWRARVIPKTLARRDLVSTHRNLGIIMALPIIATTLTGASLAFPDQTRYVLAAMLSSRELPKPPKVGVGQVDWAVAMTRAQAAYPQAKLRRILWPKKPGDPVIIRLKQADEWNPTGRTIVWIDPATSQIAGTIDALKLQNAQAAYNLIYPLHAAKLGTGAGARLVDLVTALTGLALATLGLVGAFSFVRTLSRPALTTNGARI
jgi:uncharacterized iron-regulated membrane protein